MDIPDRPINYKLACPTEDDYTYEDYLDDQFESDYQEEKDNRW